jgi:hypothetical protein
VKRIQRRRTKGWRMPEGAVYVGRPTKWGNPYRPDEVVTANDVVTIYRHVLLGEYEWPEVAVTPEDVKRELRGRDLVCWCPLDRPCHADVLLEVAA